MTVETTNQPSTYRILQLLTAERSLGYAQLSPELIVLDASENLREYMAEPWFEGEIRGQLLSRLFWEFIGAEGELNAILQGNSPDYLLENVNHLHADGIIRYITFRVVPLNEKAPHQGLLLTVADNTTIATLQQQLIQERNALRLAQDRLLQANDALTRLDRMKSLFLSIAAHDLRAPLSAIRGSADLIRTLTMQGENDPNETIEFLDGIITQADNLNRLISDILDLDQIEQGRLTIHPRDCDLESLTGEVCATMTPVAVLLHDVQLQFSASGGAVPIWGDPDRVRQILYNLIGNALKYTPATGSVQVSCFQEDHCGIVSVADNGRGIAEKDLSRIFSLYYRTEEALHSQARGVGLGLYIVKHLVDALDGTISVKSQPERGTTFTVRLPCRTLSQTGA